MATSRTGHSGEDTRRGGFHLSGPGDQPVSTARWMGVVLVLGALFGGILLAGGGDRPSDPPPGKPTPSATPTVAPTLPPGGSLPLAPTIAPILSAPDEPLTTRRTWTAEVTIPNAGVELKTLDLVVFRNGRQVSSQHLKDDATITVRDIQLRRGENRIAVALSNEGGLGPKSEAVLITVDDVGPGIDLREPDRNDVVNRTAVTVRGITEVGANVTVRNDTRGDEEHPEVDDRGVFKVEMALSDGRNVLVIRALDDLGNVSSQTLTVTRAPNAVDAKLTITPDVFKLRQLPSTITATLEVRDAAGKPIDGAVVTFSISPPGLPTSTYDTLTTGADATWANIALPREGASEGDGFVTARVTLPGGIVVVLTKHFVFK